MGVAPNKFLAKLASDHRQAGRVRGPCRPTKVAAFLAPLPVGRIWGVGAKGEKRLHALGIRTIGQLAALPQKVLVDHFGEVGRHLWHLAHGQDDRSVVPDREAKSISTETTFAHDLATGQLRIWLLDLVDQLASRLRHVGVRARTIDLKIRSSDFRTRTRSATLAEATNLTEHDLASRCGPVRTIPLVAKWCRSDSWGSARPSLTARAHFPGKSFCRKSAKAGERPGSNRRFHSRQVRHRINPARRLARQADGMGPESDLNNSDPT